MCIRILYHITWPLLYHLTDVNIVSPVLTLRLEWKPRVILTTLRSSLERRRAQWGPTSWLIVPPETSVDISLTVSCSWRSVLTAWFVQWGWSAERRARGCWRWMPDMWSTTTSSTRSSPGQTTCGSWPAPSAGPPGPRRSSGTSSVEPRRSPVPGLPSLTAPWYSETQTRNSSSKTFTTCLHRE